MVVASVLPWANAVRTPAVLQVQGDFPADEFGLEVVLDRIATLIEKQAR